MRRVNLQVNKYSILWRSFSVRCFSEIITFYGQNIENISFLSLHQAFLCCRIIDNNLLRLKNEQSNDCLRTNKNEQVDKLVSKEQKDGKISIEKTNN